MGVEVSVVQKPSMFFFLSHVSTATTARVASLPFAVSGSTDPGLVHGSDKIKTTSIHVFSSISTCQGPLHGLKWQYG